MMTRKDYVATATILNGMLGKVELENLDSLAIDFAKMFANDNPRFDAERFIQAVFEVK